MAETWGTVQVEQRRGVELEKIRRAMGHTNEKTAGRYVRMAASGLLDVMPKGE